ncbi:sugar ABC transporter permease [Acidaminobacter sp. JC074]|uniref:carbohydrate ABC transporter permease n=1 Tax=Acidaminobacter sp. JC074 TaxID=2530199 RepID=UPI001F0EF486|nr:sugar ABC transporter permease [Acidaminobacter sp. JC074]MCH4887504.1 sugar ABC transporter permease [Acidaminobacter sp. JC074]
MEKSLKKRILNKEDLVAYAFLLPAILFFGTFVFFPILKGLYNSFFNYTWREFTFIGLDNYKALIQDEIFLKSLKNTLLIVAVAVPFIIVFSLSVSLLIYRLRSGTRSFFRAVFYLPVVTGSVAVTVVWRWIYDPYSGVLNYILKTLGIIDDNIIWLGDSKFAIFCIIAVLLTTSVGQPIILYIASLGNIDKSYIEAAKVDGANSWQVFRNIKWPLLMPTTLYIVVISTINSFQIFSLIQLLTSGGPNYSTSTVMYLVYEKAFKLGQFGYAAAMGVVLAFFIGLFSILQFKFFGKEVSY